MPDTIEPMEPEMTPAEFALAIGEVTPKAETSEDQPAPEQAKTIPSVTGRGGARVASENVAPTETGISILPATESEVNRQTQKYLESRQTVEQSMSPELESLGKLPGVPLQEGVDTWTYLQYKARKNVEDQVRFLGKKFGEENVRINEMGKPVVRMVNPETGKPEDHTVDPWEMNMQSVAAFMASEVPAIA